MVRKVDVDLAAVERDYRAGMLTNVELAKRYGVSEAWIRKKADQLGWQRDLSAEIHQSAKEKLARSYTRDPASDAVAVQAAVEVIVNVVLEHRGLIGRSRRIAETLMVQLESAIGSRELIEELIDAEAEDDQSSARRNMMLKAVSLPEHAKTLQSLADTLTKLVKLEREAFDVDGDKQKGGGLEQLLAGVEV